MPTTVIDTVKCVLDDGTVIECKPLKLKYLRKFMARIAALTDVVDDNLGSLDILLDCCEIAFEQYKYEATREEIEERFDMPQIYRVIEGASGIILDDRSAANPQ